MPYLTKVILSLIYGFAIAYELHLYVKYHEFFSLGFAVSLTLVWAVVLFGGAK